MSVLVLFPSDGAGLCEDDSAKVPEIDGEGKAGNTRGRAVTPRPHASPPRPADVLLFAHLFFCLLISSFILLFCPAAVPPRSTTPMDARALPICSWCRRAPTGDGAIDFNELEMVATMRKEMVAQRAKRSGVGARIKLTAHEAERRAMQQVRREVTVRVCAPLRLDRVRRVLPNKRIGHVPARRSPKRSGSVSASPHVRSPHNTAPFLFTLYSSIQTALVRRSRRSVRSVWLMERRAAHQEVRSLLLNRKKRRGEKSVARGALLSRERHRRLTRRRRRSA